MTSAAKINRTNDKKASRGTLFSVDGNQTLFQTLASQLDLTSGSLAMRQFPDGESYVNVNSDVNGQDVVLLCSLNQPDNKILKLLFLADDLRDLGAKSVGLVSPYLAYMRQDTKFNKGEALTSKTFASLLNERFDWLVTVDPHLHRYHSLSEIYSIPAKSLHAATLLSTWIKENTNNAFLLGPDEESEQWVSDVAQQAGVPCGVSRKERHGDRSVTVHFPPLNILDDQPIILVDDIISSGHTMIESVLQLKQQFINPVWCVAVHGIFAENADSHLLAAGADRLITTNSIAQPHAQIDVSNLIAQELRRCLASENELVS
ncbi:ribose-phosphate pyrophosphokinase [Alkalimarinus alittae]|uniref:Ribose-phosphate pyrophosphokinase n=1 Tax=Alkalimarinus alittae TaxID=2961619 RepID=A0ABY6MXG1_9ALTE|nr:ribose-phosphate pyrophosphokinase [Alkalimarinus alittae]UZE94511.1 ribose-phosphate pyrophosphokinase [Alkalimarinus alittae]